MMYAKNRKNFTNTRREYQRIYGLAGSVEKRQRPKVKVEKAKKEVAMIIKENPKNSVSKLIAITGSLISMVSLSFRCWVNRQNCRMWSIDNLSWFEEHLIYSLRMTVWGAISCDRIVGSFFFKDTVTGDFYLDQLKTQFWPKIVNDEFANRVVFMENGASPSYTNKVREWL
uniref:DDE_Tnp_ISL3 domain-containing protein n=1 Tax=Strongyloides stercoralis TaxID=6248 RepID=A0A0K0EPP8_STRER